jgi:transcriptional regulator of nitric oxide reductase
MRRIGLAIVLAAGAFTVLYGQARPDTKLQDQLKRLFPNATSFSAKIADPPHYKAYAGDARDPNALLGFAFWTTDLTPLERGYDGPIKVLVGMTPQAKLTGIIVAEHKEPFGNFSIDTAGFQEQFKGKDIRDQFKVGDDIDAITRATISVTTVSRSVRNSGRRIARVLLMPPGTN